MFWNASVFSFTEFVQISKKYQKNLVLCFINKITSDRLLNKSVFYFILLNNI